MSTPGPWEAIADGDFGWKVVSLDYGTLFTSHQDPSLVREGVVVMEEHEANAHLIAAAPDLLAVLEAIISCHDNRGTVYLSAIEQARAATTKAKSGE